MKPRVHLAKGRRALILDPSVLSRSRAGGVSILEKMASVDPPSRNKTEIECFKMKKSEWIR